MGVGRVTRVYYRGRDVRHTHTEIEMEASSAECLYSTPRRPGLSALRHRASVIGPPSVIFRRSAHGAACDW